MTANTPAFSAPQTEPSAKLSDPEAAPRTTVADTRDVSESETLTIVLGGDIGLNGSREPVRTGRRHAAGSLLRWQDMTADIDPLITGDVNFAISKQ